MEPKKVKLTPEEKALAKSEAKTAWLRTRVAEARSLKTLLQETRAYVAGDTPDDSIVLAALEAAREAKVSCVAAKAAYDAAGDDTPESNELP